MFWTYIIPVLPVFLTWDAFVSCLRAYSVKELQAMVDGLDGNGYVWEVGVDPARPFPVTYLFGYPHVASNEYKNERISTVHE